MIEENIMKNITNSKLFSTLLFFLTVLLIAKLVWVVISIFFLPKSGIDYTEKNKLKSFYYPVRLSNIKEHKVAPVVIKPTTRPKAPVKKVVPVTMNGYKLLAIYLAGDTLIVTVSKGAKTKVLGKGDVFNGFKLVSSLKDIAFFTKGGKQFELPLKNIKKAKTKKIARRKVAPKRVKNIAPPSVHKKGIVAAANGETKVVSKGLLSSYTKDIDKVWKDIGIGEYKVNGVLTGFKVNFIKKNSDFEKLGLKRGDILTSINGQELDSYNAAFSFYKEMDSIENLTLSIKRNNQDMELEYEIQ